MKYRSCETKYDGSGVLHERLEKNVFSAQVEVIRWFVKQQKVRWMQQQTEQGIAAALASGKHADWLEDVVAREKKASEQAAQFRLRRCRRQFAQVVEDARLGIEFLVLILREIVRLGIVAKLVFAFRERLGVREKLNQG